MNNKTALLKIMESTYYFAPGLNKDIFHWDKTPKSVKVLAGTDKSGIIMYCGSEYYINFQDKTGIITIENNH